MGILTGNPSPRRAPVDLAAVIGDNLVPIAGVLLLGWSAPSLVVIYFAGFMLDVAACIAILWSLDPDTPRLVDGPATPMNRLKGMLGLGVGVGGLLAIVAAVMGYPLFIMFAANKGVSALELLSDRGFLMALALHLLMAGRGYLHLHRDYARESLEDPAFRIVPPMRRRFAYVTSRWVVVYAVSFFLGIPAVLVVAYCVASIWFELKPPNAGTPP